MRNFICLLLMTTLCGPALAESKSLEDKVTQAIIEQTNEFRKSKSLEPVVPNESLTRCAKQFAQFMAETDKYGHRADGRTPAQRAEAAGYDYCVVRENIAYRTNTGEVTSDSLTEVFVSGWIDSPPHRENMLEDYVTETGVAVASEDGVTYYAVQLFGRPETASYRIHLTNTSGEARRLVIRAGDEKNTVEIRPRMILEMTRCFPSKLTLKDSQSSITIRESAKLRIEDGQLLRDKDE